MSTITPKTGGGNPDWTLPVSFPDWHAVLQAEPMEAPTKERYATAIISYLGFLKKARGRASIASARQYLDESVPSGSTGQITRDALRWFFRAWRRTQGAAGASVGPEPVVSPPTPMPIEANTPPWEAELIRGVRVRGLLWNTEQAYRGWLRRFAATVAPTLPPQCGAVEVSEFLTGLAVREQVAASTQRQALNALVFYYREVLRRDLGDLGDFRRSSRHPHVPVVLSRREVQRLFAVLGGTWRLMAELQYGSGLRVTELVELRVNSVDLERRRLLVFGGKGNRVYGSPTRLSSQAGVSHDDN